MWQNHTTSNHSFACDGYCFFYIVMHCNQLVYIVGEDSDDERKKKKSKKNRRPCRIKVIDDDVDDSDGLEVR